MACLNPRALYPGLNRRRSVRRFFLSAVRHRSIVHVAQPLDAGVPAAAGALVEDQVSRGWSVGVACPPGSSLRRIAVNAGARYLAWPAGRSPNHATAQETRKLASLLGSIRPDIVHLHSSKAGLAGRLALRGKTPTIFQPHAWSFEAARGPLRAASLAWERWAARWADAIVCVAPGERERAEAEGVRGQWAEVPNGVDLNRWRAASEEERVAARRALSVDPGCKLAVVVGRLSEQKGQDLLLEVWPRVLEQVPEAELALVGDGPRREALVRMAVPHVRFAGDSRDIAGWLAAADVVVAPSRWEGLSLVVLEAMARGRSVVATDVSGMRHALGDDAGAVVSLGDGPALAGAVTARLLDGGLAASEGEAGRRRAEQRFDLRATAAKMAEVYEDVLARRRALPPH